MESEPTRCDLRGQFSRAELACQENWNISTEPIEERKFAGGERKLAGEEGGLAPAQEPHPLNTDRATKGTEIRRLGRGQSLAFKIQKVQGAPAQVAEASIIEFNLSMLI